MSRSWETTLCPWLAPSYARIEQARRKGQLGHAWLLAGPRGIGKANLAWVVAGRVLRPGTAEPVELDAATAAELLRARYEDRDHHPDLHHLAPVPDKRTISVEQVRDVIATLELTSHDGAAKALVVEPAERLTLAAANALLKTLEEPTPSTYFFLVSHQPGLLPATVRSRCQVSSLGVPPARLALAWLGALPGDADGASRAALLALSGGAPLRALELYEANYMNINRELEDIFNQISEYKIDPQRVADEWLKGDPEVRLAWLAARLEWAIKGRLAPGAWTPVTDLGGDGLHNTWRGLTLQTLFARWQETRSLLARLGSGINVELALRVLLLGFQAERG